MTSLVWFQATDLRLADNPALRAAAERGAVVPVFVWAPDEEQPWSPGGATRWWLHASLSALDKALRARGSRLVLRQAEDGSQAALLRLADQVGARAVFWNRRYEPFAVAREQRVERALAAHGMAAAAFNASLLIEPWALVRPGGGPWRVFTPFWNACQKLLASTDRRSAVEPAPDRLAPPDTWPSTEPLSALRLAPRPDWAGGLRATWQPGEVGAQRALDRFVNQALGGYVRGRDVPGSVGTSRLSPHLHAGEISPRQVLAALPATRQADAFVRELGWREFAYHLLWHVPQTAEQPLDANYARFPWRDDPHDLEHWRTARTGYPLVDAGLRELWQTGWMHNRVRMLVASFLSKDLLLPWQDGARWFWDTLVDADLANNTLGWQWTAGCGADAAPFFRVFNPVLQGQRFDPDGAYVRRYVPELARLPDAYLHHPWTAPPLVLAEAGISLGSSYPWPMIDHAVARQRALDAYATVKPTRAGNRAEGSKPVHETPPASSGRGARVAQPALLDAEAAETG